MGTLMINNRGKDQRRRKNVVKVHCLPYSQLKMNDQLLVIIIKGTRETDVS